MTKCGLCGKPIKFIRDKKNRVNIPVEETPVCFVPPDGFKQEELFINAAGFEVKGCHASDGMLGYRKHIC